MCKSGGASIYRVVLNRKGAPEVWNLANPISYAGVHCISFYVHLVNSLSQEFRTHRRTAKRQESDVDFFCTLLL
jgi:hypothetical protein